MNVLARLEEIVAKAAANGEPTLPRSLVSKVTVLLREQLATQAERERVVAEASSSFARRYAAQLQSALARAAADAPVATPPPALPAPSSARAATPPKPRASSSPRPSSRGVTTRRVEVRALSGVPEGLIVFYQGVGATIEPPGMVLEDGKTFDNPTPAAVWVNRGEPVNGWSVWKFADGRSLQECWDSGDWPEP